MKLSSAFALFTFSAFLAGCGTVWTIGFMGATLSVQIPVKATPTLTATATTIPATQEKP